MSSNLNPYLNFQDNARQAMEFYQGALGGELTLNTFGEFHASDDPAEADKIMHALLKTPAGFTLMAADTPNQMQFTGHAGFSVSLSGDDAAELQGYWDALSEGGQVVMPLERQIWGDTFGMVVDRFGVTWMVNIAGQ
ncbi:VOC family protein [Arthrobacter woluwensis]|uniref:PhnB protein n=1 Tax=Arthrobacter woluwensis TaxID=156980 RepID=A0A1H4PMT6_9MICC|nr:VOC family protein [Arthrobacter woluwensis]PSS45312.1 VOC family protein [Arthrobacter woluwensis]SEC08558.1 PhnB protein [Arthrobacter woluwensis]